MSESGPTSCGKPMVGYHGTMIGEALAQQRKDKGINKLTYSAASSEIGKKVQPLIHTYFL